MLVLYAAANALLVTAIAVGHPWTQKSLATTSFDRLLVAYGIFWEAAFLILPVLVIALALAVWKRKIGLWCGALALPFVPVVYYADLMSSLLLDERIWSSSTLQLVGSLIPWLPDYLSESQTGPVLVWAAVFLAAEAATLILAGWGVTRWSWRPGPRSRGMLGIVAALFLLPFVDALAGGGEWRRSLADVPDQHPLSLLGINDQSDDLPETISLPEAALAAYFLRSCEHLGDIKRNYQNLAITDSPRRQPDILIVIAESLRADALGPKSAPNLTKLAAESLTSTRHFSGGNTSTFGQFGLLYGLDPVFYKLAGGRWSPALPRLLGEAGYYTAFLGSGDYNWGDMNQLIVPEQYDRVELVNELPYTHGDAKVCELAAELLNRQGNAARLQDRPVCVVLGTLCTHHDYHSEPRDRVFQPAFNDDIPLPPYRNDERSRLRNRYLNSVHALDRMLAPLLGRDRIIVVVGDHGESLGEDGRIMHSTAASIAQITTPLIFHVPGRKAATVEGPTSHLDILPSLLDVLEFEINTPHALSGRSIFQTRASQENDPLPRRFGVGLYEGPQVALLGGTERNGFPPRVLHIKASLNPPKFRLTGIGNPKGEVAIPSDTTLFDATNDRLVRDFELWMETTFGSQGHVAGAAKELRQALHGTDPEVRAEACRLIGRLGPKAGPFIPDLKAQLGDTPIVRKAASLALSRLYDGNSLQESVP